MSEFELADGTAQDGSEDSSTSTDQVIDNEGVTDGGSPTPVEEPVAEGNAVTNDEGAAPSKGAQERIRQLVAKQHEAEREAAYWKGKAEAGKTPEDKGPDAPAQPDLMAKPNPDNFENGIYDPAYIEALTDYKIVQREQAAEAKRRAETEQAKAAERESAWSRQIAETARTKPDFSEVVLNNPTLSITKVMADAIKESDKGAEVAYWLGKNPQEASRIAALTPFAAVRELGRIEEKLSSSKAPAAEPNRISNASEPIKPLAGKSDGVKDTSKMTDAEWHEHYKAERIKKLSGK